jgi:hypothetical protein
MWRRLDRSDHASVGRALLILGLVIAGARLVWSLACC